MRNFYQTLILLVIVKFGIAQSGVVSGTVVSAEGPVPGALISISDLELATTSNGQGAFKLESIPSGVHELRISSFGYTTELMSVAVANRNPVVLRVELTPSSALLDEVVVSGTLREVRKSESPVPVEVYGKTFFRANPSPSIFEGIQFVNGVRPQVNCNVCNTGDVRINGLPGPYTMFLIDGMPIVSGLSTVYGLNGIPQALIEQIEVVKGPASTLYGSEAVGA